MNEAIITLHTGEKMLIDANDRDKHKYTNLEYVKCIGELKNKEGKVVEKEYRNMATGKYYRVMNNLVIN